MANPNEVTEAHIAELKAQLQTCLDEMPGEVNKDEKAEVWEKFESLENFLLDLTTEIEYRAEARTKRYRAGLRGDALHDDDSY